MTQSGSADDPRRAARVATVAALAVIASFIAGKAARDAILLSNYDVTSLPLFVGISAVLSLPLVVFAGRLMTRIGPARLMPVLNAISAVLLVGEWVLLRYQPRVAAVICFIHLSSLGAVLVSGYWSIVNERFDARSAKRHIGRIGLGATLGGIVGGLVAERSAVYLEDGAVLLVVAGLQVVCALMLRGLAGPDIARHDVDAVPAGETWSSLRQVWRMPLLRNLGAVVLLGAIAAAALDYQFKAEVTHASGTAGPLRFFAVYYTVTNVLTAVVQVALSRVVVSRFGVARSLSVLPGTVVSFGIGAMVVPGLWSAVIARASEQVTRSSMFRAAYELVYAPLSEQAKRPTKIILDVGAERVGDLLGAQIVGAIIFTVAAPRPWLLAAAVIAGLLGLAFAMLLPRSYTAALETSLVAHGGDTPEPEPDGSLLWSTIGRSTLAETGDLTAMSLLDLRAAGPPRATRASVAAMPIGRRSGGRAPPVSAAPAEPDAHPHAAPPGEHDPIAERVAALRSGDATRVRAALAGKLPPELAPLAVQRIGWDAVAPAVVKALRAIAPQCTGVLADALLDPGQDFTIRRRLPGILVEGAPELARWALWRGLSDPRFEVRYRCGRALAKLQAAGRAPAEDLEAVLALVTRELSVGGDVWRSHHLLDGQDDADPSGEREASILRDILHRRSANGLDHVFTLLALALPAEPVRIAFQGVFTEDRALRAIALEYLESVLPAEVRELLWPMIEADHARPATIRPAKELAAALALSHPAIVANLRDRAGRERT